MLRRLLSPGVKHICCHRAAASSFLGENCRGFSSNPLTEEMVGHAHRAFRKAKEEYHSVPAAFPTESQPGNGDLSITPDMARRRRTIYRSNQRGLSEVDILLGEWAKDNVMSLTDQELAQYELILDLETIDLLNIFTGKQEAPAEYQTPMLTRLFSECTKRVEIEKAKKPLV